MQTFDPHRTFSIFHRRLPHWAQAGTVSFITWRTLDSMPASVIREWISQRNELLRRAGIVIDAPTPTGQANWRELIVRLPLPDRIALRIALLERWDGFLDECHGECLLKRSELSAIVMNCPISW